MDQLEQNQPASAAVSGKVQRQRVGVLVLGMHRSGTSLLSRLLNLYGCDLPNNLLPANQANSEGYWESAAIVAFNDALLASGGSRWHDWLGFNHGWYASPKKDEYLDRARDILRAEYGKSGLFVLKDPRICRLVPFWLEVLEQEGIQPVIVLPIRHPAMVARSLAMRDSISPAVGHLLWLRHILDAEAATRGRPRAVMTYSQLLEDWQALPERMSSALGVQWPRTGLVSRTEQASFINPDMAHSEGALQNHPLSQNLTSGVARAWGILADWAETGEKTSDYAVLDVLRERLDHAGDLTGEAIISSMNAHWLSLEKEQQVNDLKGQLSQATIQLDAQRAEARDNEAAMEDRISLLVTQLDAARAAIAEKEQDLSTAKDQLAKTQISAQLAEADINRLAERSDDLQAKLSVTQSNLQQRYAELDQLRHDLERAQDAEHRQIENNAVLHAEITGARERIAASEQDIAAIREELEVTCGRLDTMIARNISLEQDAAFLRGRIDIVEAARDDANQRNRMLENVADTLRMQDIRVARLTEEIHNARAQADQAQREARDYAQQAAQHSSAHARLNHDLVQQREDHESILRDMRAQADTLQQNIEKRFAQTTFEQQQWLLAVHQAMIEPGRWWAPFLPSSYRERLIRRRLARRDLFDSDAYLSRYEDVARSGMDPLQHYMRHGIYEGRIRNEGTM